MNRAAVIGCGSIGDRHTGVLRQLLGADRVVQFPAGLRQGVPPDEVVESVLKAHATHIVIASPAHLHLDFAWPLLAAGAHCLIEKPIFLSSAEVSHFQTHSSNLSSLIQVGYNLHYTQEYQFLVDNIDKLGPLLWAEFRCGQALEQWRPGRALDTCVTVRKDWGGGVLRELSHEIEMALALLGPLTPSVAIMQRGRFGSQVEEAAQLSLRSGSGCPVNIQLDLYRPVPERTVFLVGEQGELKVDMVAHTGYCHVGSQMKPIEFDTVDTYQLQAQAFLSNQTLPYSPKILEALATVDLIEQIICLAKEV